MKKPSCLYIAAAVHAFITNIHSRPKFVSDLARSANNEGVLETQES